MPISRRRGARPPRARFLSVSYLHAVQMQGQIRRCDEQVQDGDQHDELAHTAASGFPRTAISTTRSSSSISSSDLSLSLWFDDEFLEYACLQQDLYSSPSQIHILTRMSGGADQETRHCP